MVHTRPDIDGPLAAHNPIPEKANSADSPFTQKIKPAKCVECVDWEGEGECVSVHGYAF